jgi:conserved oligomeric Golgi complex subunit 3
MEDRLQYFYDFDKIAKILNVPGDDICLNENFIPTLSRLDDCLDFVEKNAIYKDAELFGMRFRQCMTRALSLIKLYFSNVMRGISNELASRLSKVCFIRVVYFRMNKKVLTRRPP